MDSLRQVADDSNYTMLLELETCPGGKAPKQNLFAHATKTKPES